MGILDFVRRKLANPDVFNFVGMREAPSMKGDEYLKAYKGWVYACTNAISEEIATIDLRLEQLSNGKWVEVQNHLVLDLLKDVNSLDTFRGLLIATQSYLELEGNAFWYLPKGEVTNKPGEIWGLNPIRTRVVKDKTNVVGGYVFRNEKGVDIPLTTDEIIHFRRFNPQSRFRGIGTVRAAALAIDIDTFSAQWNKNFFYNSAMPSAVLETKGELTEEQFERLKAEWNKKYTGLNKAHKLAILQGGLQYKPAQLSQKDMEFLEQRRFSRDEILGIFRVPKTVLGITEDVNRANAEASDFVFAKRVIKPRMEFLVDRLNEFLLRLFDLDQEKWRFNFTDPVPQNLELELKDKETALRGGWRTINETRESEGRPPISNGDSIMVPFNLFPLGSVEDKTVKRKVTKQSRRFVALVGSRREFIHDEIKRITPQYQKIIQNILGESADRIRKTKGIEGETKAIQKARIDDILRLLRSNHDGDIEVLRGKNFEVLQNVLSEGGKAAISILGVDNIFDTTSQEALTWLDENALSAAKTINRTVKETVRQDLLNGVREGLSNDKLAEKIEDISADISLINAKRIARTETVKAYAEGSLQGYKQSGLVIGKEWITAGDDLVDDDCLSNEADGVISLNASFSTGESAPPEHPNCRCVLRPYTGSELELRMLDKVSLRVDKELTKYSKKLERENIEVQKTIKTQSAKIVKQAKTEGEKIIKDAKTKAKKDEKKILQELVDIRDKSLKKKYG